MRLTVNQEIEAFLKRSRHVDREVILMGMIKLLANRIDLIEAELAAERLAAQKQTAEILTVAPPSDSVN